MSDEQITFLSFDQAMGLVAAIQEEEDLDDPERRVLTVYDHEERELCWFDFDETMKAVGQVEKSQLKEAVQDYILHHIPEWVLQR